MSSKDIKLAIVAVVLGVALGVAGFLAMRAFDIQPDESTDPSTPEQQEQSAEPEGDEAQPEEGEATPDESAEDDGLAAEAARIVSEMTLEEKVAQLFVVYPEQITGVSVQTLAGDATREALSAYPVGGIVFFAQNLEGPDQTVSMLSNFQAYSHDLTGLPIFLCVDEEGGSVVRIADNPAFGVTDVGNACDIGATGNVANAGAAGAAIGSYLGNLGFNVDFAPVADVANNPNSLTMALRSYGSEASVVADMVSACIHDMLATGVYPCVKHFPGIGGAVGDSETGYIETSKSIDEMSAEELLPFQAAVDAGVPLVMVGHITCTGISDSGLPASLDPAVISILRDQLGYEGIIITDALSMGAVVELYPASDMGVQTLLAGADMLLMPQDFAACYQGVLDAVADGRLSEERINESVTRIVEAKLALEG